MVKKRVNKAFPEISVDDLLAIWENIDVEDSTDSSGDEAPTCKHMFIKGRNANTQYKTKVKGGGEYCSKHKPRAAIIFKIRQILKTNYSSRFHQHLALQDSLVSQYN
jgi:hypothetical protein